jgi:hypothetical protein
VTVLQTYIRRVFSEADTCPDNVVTKDELLRWVSHCQPLIQMFRNLEPSRKVFIDEDVFRGMHDIAFGGPPTENVEERKA